ncbi:MAG: hypothetical protein H6536_07015 [Bacteroidales bacterium]|nr:hypothetical protein [Bacteroidales bacterium]
MDKNLLVTSIALAFFIICPRLAGIVHVVCKYSELPLIKTALIGSIIAIPLVLLMIWIYSKFGIIGALAFGVVTDLVSAYLLKSISIKASIDTLIIAVFVLVAVKVAPLISGAIIK